MKFRMSFTPLPCAPEGDELKTLFRFIDDQEILEIEFDSENNTATVVAHRNGVLVEEGRSPEDFLRLAARFALIQLYENPLLKEFAGTADGCNLWDLLQEGLGNHDEHPQVLLEDIVAEVTKQIPPDWEKNRIK